MSPFLIDWIMGIPEVTTFDREHEDAHEEYLWDCRLAVQLCGRGTDRKIPGEISPLTTSQYFEVNRSWMTSFSHRACNREHDDDGWMWTAGMSPFGGTSECADQLPFGLMVGHGVEGLLLLRKQPATSRLFPELCLVYVTYMATAPWNRRDRSGHVGLRGIGTALVEFAAEMSHRTGCGRRLGLHSLRSSDSFYRHLGFRDLGRDAAKFGMNYFERLPEQSAVEFPSSILPGEK